MESVLAEIGKLPVVWHESGSVSRKVLHAIARHGAATNVRYSAETGTGKTTLLLSHLSQNHTVFTLDAGMSLTQVRTSPLLNVDTVTFIEGPSQRTLPYHTFDQPIQLVMLDGPHGFPFPELEYYYIYPHIEKHGLLIIDDIHIPTVRNVFLFLKDDEMFDLVEIVDNTAFFRRTNAPVFSPLEDGWWQQRYNVKRFPIPATMRGWITRPHTRLEFRYRDKVPSRVRHWLRKIRRFE